MQLVMDWFASLQQLNDSGQYDQGLKKTIYLLKQLLGSLPFKVTRAPMSPEEYASKIVYYYSRFVLMADRAAISENYVAACNIKPTLGPLFDTAGIGELSPHQILEKYHPGEDLQSLTLQAALYLTVLSNVHLYPGEKIRKIDPQLIAPLAVGCLAQRYAITKRQTTNKKALLTIGDYYETMAFSNYTESAISMAWMYCSYLFWEKKHDIKNNLNKILLRWMDEKRLISKKTPKYIEKQKPTILIFAEVFADHHAMFRCHGQSAVSLKENFRTILVSDLKHITAATRKLFTKVVQMDRGEKSIEKNIKLIRSFRPDIIYYPSVGMNRNTCYLSNLRLAPIQFLSMGHPASTFSKEMDYVVVNNDLRPDPKCFSEKLIHRRISAGYNPYPGWSNLLASASPFPPTKRKRVGVLGFIPKITQEILQVCRALEEKIPNGVEFHFFPNIGTMDFYALVSLIKSEVKTAVVHPSTSYMDYMGRIKQLDLILSTFPFGNTNGTIDTLLMRKPMIALDGPEPHSKTDSRLLRKAGAPEECITYSPREYLDRAVDWLTDDQKLAAIGQQLEKLDIEGTFFNNTDNDFAEIVSLIYTNHQTLQKDDRREFEYEDLLAIRANNANQSHPDLEKDER